jgi:hypothetical protein
MGDEKDMFTRLRWEKDIRSLGAPHISFNPSPEFEFAVGNRSSDDYELTPFSHYTSMEVEGAGGAETIREK